MKNGSASQGWFGHVVMVLLMATPGCGARKPGSAVDASATGGSAGAASGTGGSAVDASATRGSAGAGSGSGGSGGGFAGGGGAGCPTPSTWFRDLDGDGFGDDRASVSACQAPSGHVATGGDCNDSDRLRHPTPVGQEPLFVLDRCGQGRVVEPMTGATTGWTDHMSTDDGTGRVAMTAETTGCKGGGLVMTYDLPTPSTCGGESCAWVVRRKQLSAPLDLSGEDYLLFPYAGEAGDPNFQIDLKLQGSNGCLLSHSIRNATDLPVRRTVVVPLAWFSSPELGHSCTVNLEAVTAVEIGVVGRPPASGTFADDTGRLHLDAITAVRANDLRLTPTAFDCAPPQPAVRRRIADDLLARHKVSLSSNRHPFVPSWFEETPPQYWTYNQALLLGVLSIEAARGGDPAFRQAATAVADTLVMLQKQVTSGPGRWHDLYQDAAQGAVTGGLTPGGDLAFSWYANTAWVIINLDLFRDLVAPVVSKPYDDAIEAAALWLEGQLRAFGAAGGAPGSITKGTEGNVSTMLGLIAANHLASAAAMRDHLLSRVWNARDGRFWMGIDHPGLAIDVVGNWGASVLRAVGEHDKALAGLGLAAGVFPARSFDGSIIGLGDIAGPYQPTVEFVGQFLAAGGPGSATLMRETLKLETNGTFPGSPNDLDTGDGWNTRWHGLAPATWVYFALSPDHDVLGRLTLPR